MNNFEILPKVLIGHISTFAGPETKRALSMLDQRIRKAVLNVVKCIRVFARCPRRKKHPPDILVKVISRYPRLKEIIFGSPKNWSGSNDFGARDAPYLRSLIAYLTSKPEQHPLSSVRKIVVREIKGDSFYGENARGLNSLFLEALGHEGLETIHIRPSFLTSILTESDIQPLLNRSLNLRKFVFYDFQSRNTVALSFARQTQLKKVELLKWMGPASTIASLKSCAGLKELVIDRVRTSFEGIRQILLEEHPWDLKRLELKDIDLDDEVLDAFTKKLPNLEWLGVELQGISEEGMEILGRNCPKLRILEFSKDDLTNSGLGRLTRNLPHLEVIHFDKARHITEEGVASIARNCNYLRVLRIHHYQKIKRSGIDALIDNCPHLKVVGFERGGPILLEDLCYLVESKPELRHITFDSVPGILLVEIRGFYAKFPKVSEIPTALSTAKLYKLSKGFL